MVAGASPRWRPRPTRGPDSVSENTELSTFFKPLYALYEIDGAARPNRLHCGSRAGGVFRTPAVEVSQ